MKTNLFLTVILAFITSTAVFAQNPVPDLDTLPDPVKEGDPAVRNLPPRTDYSEALQRITPAELPEPVKQTLESSAQYTGWQKAMVYHDEKKEAYVVEFVEAGATTAYRFSKDGKPILEE